MVGMREGVHMVGMRGECSYGRREEKVFCTHSYLRV